MLNEIGYERGNEGAVDWKWRVREPVEEKHPPHICTCLCSRGETKLLSNNGCCHSVSKDDVVFSARIDVVGG